MKRPTLQLNASTRIERFEMTALVRSAFQENKGWILDTHAFSNLSLNFHFEVAFSHLSGLYNSLSALGLRWTIRSEMQWKEWLEDAANRGMEELVKGSLQVSFLHDKPELKQDIPAVPG